MYIIYLTSSNNLFKEIKKKRVEMEKSEDKKEKFFEKIYFPYPHRKHISSIRKENADEARKRFRRIIPH